MSILDGEGGYIIPERSPIAAGLKREFRRLLRKHGRKSLIKLYLEKGVYNFYLKVQDIKAVSAVDVWTGNARDAVAAKTAHTSKAKVAEPAVPPPPQQHAEPRPRRPKDEAGRRATIAVGCSGCLNESCAGKAPDAASTGNLAQGDIPGVDYYPFHRRV